MQRGRVSTKDILVRFLDGMIRPYGLAVSMCGDVYVLAFGWSNVVCFSSDGKWIRTIGHHGLQNGQLNWPKDIAIGMRYGTSADILKTLSSVDPLTTFPPGLVPLCASYYGEEQLYVADNGNERLQALTLSGEFLWKANCSRVKTCIIDPRENTLYALTEEAHIVGFSHDGREQPDVEFRWNEHTYFFGRFRDMCMSESGNVYSIGYRSDAIDAWNPDDSYKHRTTLGSLRGAGKLRKPSKIIVRELGDGQHLLYVADTRDRCVKVYQPTGELIECYHGSKETFFHPCALAIDQSRGLLYVSDSYCNRVVVLRLLPILSPLSPD